MSMRDSEEDEEREAREEGRGKREEVAAPQAVTSSLILSRLDQRLAFAQSLVTFATSFPPQRSNQLRR